LLQNLHLKLNSSCYEKIWFPSLLAFCGVLSNCSKDKWNEPLEITYKAKINVNDNNVINDKIEYKDIIGYDTSNYTFLIDSNAIKKIRNYFFPSEGLPFL